MEAEEGEPVAVTMLAADALPWGRSVKYHRPRGPACLRGRCDGCLARVEGLPSRRTCLIAARDGLEVTPQPLLGSPRHDPLALSDALFRKGLDHHQLGTTGPLLYRATVSLVRAVSGLGRLPECEVEAATTETRSCDVLVVGAGPAGLCAAEAAIQGGATVLLVDEAPEPGGHLRDRPGAERDVDESARRLQRAEAHGLRYLPGHRALGVYEEPGRGSPLPVLGHTDPLRDPPFAPVEGTARLALLVHASGLTLVRFSSLILATGLEMGAPPLVNGDLPGVYTARAGAIALRHGLLLGERIALLGSGPWNEWLLEPLRDAGADVLHRPIQAVRKLHGTRGRLGSLYLEDGSTWPCDAALVEPPPSADVRLGAQAGATTRSTQGGLFLEAAPEDGATRQPGLWVVGMAAGVHAPRALQTQAFAAGRAAAQHARDGGRP